MLGGLSSQFEAASDGYATEHGIERDPDWFVLKMQEELGELTQVWNKLSGRGRTHGKSELDLKSQMADETADLLGHVLLFAHHHKLDLASAIERKWRFQPSL
ncbi:MAG TPA: pyrophosphatase [Ensifer sp.]|jgi:NTP pyrophosphatase (non-canonical NTP hydrolase)|uniref:pyrophosphatase n=1 Tax=Ensifer sp. TaxID=1872086 RepID=UPI002E10F7B6|nr:pyrophosphatase [Ensifer sp.]